MVHLPNLCRVPLPQNSTTGDLVSDFYFARGAGTGGRAEPAAIPVRAARRGCGPPLHPPASPASLAPHRFTPLQPSTFPFPFPCTIPAFHAAITCPQATSEPSLVRDVLYAAQGVSGRALGWVEAGGDDVGSGFRPDQGRAEGLGVARTMLLERLTELGWLFRYMGVCGCMGVWLRGCVGVWVCGCMRLVQGCVARGRLSVLSDGPRTGRGG